MSNSNKTSNKNLTSKLQNLNEESSKFFPEISGGHPFVIGGKGKNKTNEKFVRINDSSGLMNKKSTSIDVREKVDIRETELFRKKKNVSTRQKKSINPIFTAASNEDSALYHTITTFCNTPGKNKHVKKKKSPNRDIGEMFAAKKN